MYIYTTLETKLFLHFLYFSLDDIMTTRFSMTEHKNPNIGNLLLVTGIRVYVHFYTASFFFFTNLAITG